VLEMPLVMIRTRVSAMEEIMKINPPLTDLEDLDYQSVDDGGAMLVEDSKDERDQENIASVHLDTPHPIPTV
jgi:hypothetical protein